MILNAAGKLCVKCKWKGKDLSMRMKFNIEADCHMTQIWSK